MTSARSTPLSEAQVALKQCLPYLEAIADKLSIAANSPEVIALHELIVRCRMALAAPSSEIGTQDAQDAARLD